MASRVGLIGCLIVALALLGSTVKATDYTVGDDFGWNVPSTDDFYENWAANKTFAVGDNLLFNGEGHTVAEVSEDDYENCVKPGIVWGTTNLRITLNETRPHYFICSVDNHCQQGMKLEINVTGNGNSSTNNNDNNNDAGSAPKSLTVVGAFVAVFVSTLAVFFFN